MAKTIFVVVAGGRRSGSGCADIVNPSATKFVTGFDKFLRPSKEKCRQAPRAKWQQPQQLATIIVGRKVYLLRLLAESTY